MSTQFGKEELVHLHLLLFQVKRAFEALGVRNEFFDRYESMNILPVQIFRQKEEHKEAILNLCMGIMKAIGKDKEVEGLCKRFRKAVQTKNF